MLHTLQYISKALIFRSLPNRHSVQNLYYNKGFIDFTKKLSVPNG